MKTSPTQADTLLTFFKVLSDETHLKIAGVLARQPMQVREMSRVLQLDRHDLINALVRMQRANLVAVQVENNQKTYVLNADAFAAVGERLGQADVLSRLLQQAQADFEQHLVAKYVEPDYVDPGRTMAEHIVIGRWVARKKFDLHARYTEPQVNDILRRIKWQGAEFRNSLCGMNALSRTRDGRMYWRSDTPEAALPGFRPETLAPSDYQLSDEIVFAQNTIKQNWRGGKMVLPNDGRQIEVMRRYLAMPFVPRKPYTAAQIDVILKRICAGDSASNRALLVKHGILRTQGDAYVLPDVTDDMRSEWGRREWMRKNMLIDGRLKEIPTESNQRLIVLQWLAEKLVPHRVYDDAQLNLLITRFHDDAQPLKQELVSLGLIRAESGHYRRVQEPVMLDSRDVNFGYHG